MSTAYSIEKVARDIVEVEIEGSTEFQAEIVDARPNPASNSGDTYELKLYDGRDVVFIPTENRAIILGSGKRLSLPPTLSEELESTLKSTSLLEK